MYQVYRPSGRVSPAFFLLMPLTLALAVPASSYLFVFLSWHLPQLALSVGALIFCVVALAFFSTHWCIKMGKVRNTRLAAIFGLLLGLAFSYFSLAFYYAFTMGEAVPVPGMPAGMPVRAPSLRELAFALHPANLFMGLEPMLGTGVSMAGSSGKVFFTLRGTPLLIARGVQTLLVSGYLAFYLWDDSREPFCETSKKWARKLTLNMEYISDSTSLLQHVMMADLTPLRTLDVLKGVNTSYCALSLYLTGEDADFYVDIVNKKLKSNTPNKKGELEYENENIVERMRIDRETGRILLTRAETSPKEVAARVVGESTKRYSWTGIFWKAVYAAIVAGLLAYALMNPNSLGEFTSNPMVFFSVSYLVLSSVLYLIGCFLEEPVVEESEGDFSAQPTSRHQIVRKADSVWTKLYFSAILVCGLIIFYLFYIRGNLL